MSEFPVHPVPAEWREKAYIDRARYDEMYRRSVEEPDAFWAEQASEFLQWDTPWHTVCDYDLREGRAAWFDGAELNASVNCIDRHLPDRADQVAIIWEGV